MNKKILDEDNKQLVYISHIKAWEIFIENREKEGQQIFLATDCPITQNYLLDKYSNIIVYKRMDIPNGFKKYCFQSFTGEILD